MSVDDPTPALLRSAAFQWEATPETFHVEELGAPEPAGSGEHLQFTLEKRGLSTWAALDRLARSLGLPLRAFGTAGLKDARATTRQAVTVLGLGAGGAGRLEALDLAGLTLGPATPTARKLHPGESTGNRFRVQLSGVGGLGILRARLEDLALHGMPNAFGPQRFGAEGRGHELGRLLLDEDPRAYLHAHVLSEERFAGGATADSALRDACAQLCCAILSNRRSEHRRLGTLARDLPATLGPLARQMARRRGDPDAALTAIPARLRRMHLGAFQARLFHAVLHARLDALRTAEQPWNGIRLLLPGDVAFDHATGHLSRILGPPECSSRRSPSGPLFGRRSPWPGSDGSRVLGRPADFELAVLEEWGLGPADLDRACLDGARRPLRVFPSQVDLGGTERGREVPAGSVQLCFTLPPGAYATILLRELRQDGAAKAEVVESTGS